MRVRKLRALLRMLPRLDRGLFQSLELNFMHLLDVADIDVMPDQDSDERASELQAVSLLLKKCRELLRDRHRAPSANTRTRHTETDRPR